jgi:hypothetical protein
MLIHCCVFLRRNVKVGRKLKFNVNALIGKESGSVFEVRGKDLVQVDEPLVYEDNIETGSLGHSYFTPFITSTGTIHMFPIISQF